MHTTSLIVTTYRRPDRLRECLSAIGSLDVEPCETIVVRRDEDIDAAAIIRDAPVTCREVVVRESGVVAAMIAGARVSAGELIGFLDDDAAPEADWLRRLSAEFERDDVGAACGRDRVTVSDAYPIEERIGQMTPYGRIYGNHHLGGGPSREVSFLKGANLLVRRSALALPLDLRGSGAQVHYEVAACRFATHAGWKLIYAPAARVDHLPGPRFDADRRGAPEARAVSDAAYNQTVAMLASRPLSALMRFGYGLVIGDRGAPGLVRALYAIVRGDRDTARRLHPSVAGQLDALGGYAAGRRVRFVVFPHHSS